MAPPPATPRRRLDRDAVDAAAETIVDREGWERLTMSGLAAELGVRVPSLYNHVPSLDALLGDLQVRAMRELSSELGRAAMGKIGANALRHLARVLRDYARRHPGRYELAMREPRDRPALLAASNDAGDALSAVIASFGAHDPTLELQVTCFSAIHGVVVLENAGLFNGVVDADPVFDRVVDLVVMMLENRANDGAPDGSEPHEQPNRADPMAATPTT